MPAVASFLQPLQPLAGPGGATADAGAPLHFERVPGIVMLRQQHTKWCWAAIAQCVLKVRRGISRSQEEIAVTHMVKTGRAQCSAPHAGHSNGTSCGDGTCGGLCNDQHFLRIILTEQGCYQGTMSAESAPAFSDLKRQIDQRRPVACRIDIPELGGHFVLVSGYALDAAGDWVEVLDPANPEGGSAVASRKMRHSEFVSSYSQGGYSGPVNYSYKVV